MAPATCVPQRYDVQLQNTHNSKKKKMGAKTTTNMAYVWERGEGGGQSNCIPELLLFFCCVILARTSLPVSLSLSLYIYFTLSHSLSIFLCKQEAEKANRRWSTGQQKCKLSFTILSKQRNR